MSDTQTIEPMFYTPAEVARLLRTTEGTLRFWRYKGEGPKAIRISDNKVLYRISDVMAYIDSRS